MSKQYIVHENKVYEKIEGALVDEFQQLQVPLGDPMPCWKGAKIPWAMWQEMVAWCQVTQKIHSSEALVFLFYDVPTSTWKHWFLPQVTSGMSVKANENHPQYAAQRKEFPDLQFGTLHHHCTASAFASGVDKSDEIDREGLHFTVGNIGAKEHTVHFRFCFKGKCYDAPAETMIECCESIQRIPERYQSRIHKEMICEPVDVKQYDFTEVLKNITKPVYQHYGRYNGIGNQQNFWEGEPYMVEKKTGDSTLENILEDPNGAAKFVSKSSSAFFEVMALVNNNLEHYEFIKGPSSKPCTRATDVFITLYSHEKKRENKDVFIEETATEIYEWATGFNCPGLDLKDIEAIFRFLRFLSIHE